MAVPDYTEEKEVLFNYYPSLCSTLTDIDPLLPRFVAAGVISAPHGFENIKSQNTILKRVQELLSHISGPLQDGNTAPFYSLLEIMEQHSTQATRKLAEKMRSDLRSSVHINFPMNNHGRLQNAADQLNVVLKQQTDMMKVIQDMKRQQEKLTGNSITQKEFRITVGLIILMLVYYISQYHTGGELIKKKPSPRIDFNNHNDLDRNQEHKPQHDQEHDFEPSSTVPAKMSTPKSDDKPEPDPNWLVFLNNKSSELSTNLSDVLSSHTNQLHTPFYFKISNYFTELKYPNEVDIRLYSTFLNISHVLPKMFMELGISMLCKTGISFIIKLKTVTNQLYDVQQQMGSWFDDLRGQFVVQLLNQHGDNDHWTEHLFKHDVACKIGHIPSTYTVLGCNIFTNIDNSIYLKNNTVFLRILFIGT